LGRKKEEEEGLFVVLYIMRSGRGEKKEKPLKGSTRGKKQGGRKGSSS